MHVSSLRPSLGRVAHTSPAVSAGAQDTVVAGVAEAELGQKLRAAARGAALPERTSVCYAGTNTIKLPNGRVVGTTQGLARRTLDPAAGTIEEWVLDKGPRGPQEYRVTMQVSGNQFTLSEANGAFTGSGELIGEPWQWTGMKHTAQLPDGTRVDTEETLDADGMSGEKRVYSPDGVLRVVISNEFQTISEEELERRRGQK